jgi:hypothetical protein
MQKYDLELWNLIKEPEATNLLEALSSDRLTPKHVFEALMVEIPPSIKIHPHHAVHSHAILREV